MESLFLRILIPTLQSEMFSLGQTVVERACLSFPPEFDIFFSQQALVMLLICILRITLLVYHFKSLLSLTRLNIKVNYYGYMGLVFS